MTRKLPSTSSSRADDARVRVSVPDVAYYRGLVACREQCPVGTDAGAYVRAIAQGRYEHAYRTASATNPLAAVCGRICGHPCESACRRGALDQPVAIRALKRFAAERGGIVRDAAPRDVHVDDRAPRVAIIGAGPAGIGCADMLAGRGVAVTIFEAAHEPGGMLTLGIPEYRLPRDVVRTEIYRVLARGVELRTHWSLGRDFTVPDLLADGYAAVFIAIGAGLGRGLSLPGHHLDGVIDGVHFLLDVNVGRGPVLGQRVAIIGGGQVAVFAARTAARTAADDARDTRRDTVLDAARSAVRVGAREVHVFAAGETNDLPARADERRDAERERVVFHASTRPVEIERTPEGDLGLVTEREPAATDDAADSRRRWQFDTVVACLGQRVDTNLIEQAVGVETSPDGTIAVDPVNLMTSHPRVFAGGDVAFGPRIAVSAIADGRCAARSILRLLGRIAPPPPTRRMVAVALDRSGEPFERTPRRNPPALEQGRRTGFREVEDSYSEPSAREQASRCLICHVATVFDERRCIACAACIEVCPQRCLRGVDASSLSGDRVAAQIDAAVGARPGWAIIKDETICTRCGLCVLRCPTNAITLKVPQEQAA